MFFIRWALQDLKSKNLIGVIKSAAPGLKGLGLGLSIGINTYITNPMNGKNIFHTMLGANKIDLMGLNIPEAIGEKGTIGKFSIRFLAMTKDN